MFEELPSVPAVVVEDHASNIPHSFADRCHTRLGIVGTQGGLREPLMKTPTRKMGKEYIKNFKDGQKVIVVFGTIQDATIIGKGSFSKYYPDHYGRYKVKYDDGTTGDPKEHLIYASREEYYRKRIIQLKQEINDCKKELRKITTKEKYESNNELINRAEKVIKELDRTFGLQKTKVKK